MSVAFITPNGSFPPWTLSPVQLTSQNIIIPFQDTINENYYISEIGPNSDWYTEPADLQSFVEFGLAYGLDGYAYICIRHQYSTNIRIGMTLRETVWNEDGTLAVAQHVLNSFYSKELSPGLWYYIESLNEDQFGLHHEVSAASINAQNKWNEPSTFKPIWGIDSGYVLSYVGGNDVISTDDIPDFSYSIDGVEISDYDYGDISGPGGGSGGSFDNSTDAVDFASLPSGGAAASGLISMFAPTSSQLAAFGQFLWTTLFDGSFDSLLTSLKKWVNDPIESVIQLAAYPVTPPSGAATTLKFCGIRSDLVGQGVVMNKCTSQFVDFDFGQLATPAYWKQALDYSPYTKVSIYLPYIGICPLASDDVIDATLHLKYHIDLLTGGFSAELKVTKNIAGTPLSSVMYNWSGNMATQIPITSSNFSQVFGSMMTAVAAIGVGAVTGGMGAAAAGGGAEAAGSAAIAGGALSGAGHGLAANIGNVINSKPHVTQSGRLDGTVGALSQFTPYLIIERPVQSLSSLFQKEQGYPSNVAQRLGDLSGLTVCEAPIMNGFDGATEEEIEEIRSYLVGGVIL